METVVGRTWSKEQDDVAQSDSVSEPLANAEQESQLLTVAQLQTDLC